jgi:hypothetical protein
LPQDLQGEESLRPIRCQGSIRYPTRSRRGPNIH